MTRQDIATCAPVLTVALACAAPAVAQEDASAAAGGAAAGLGGPALIAHPGELLGNVLRFRGRLPASAAGRTVRVQRLARGGAWVATATAVAGSDGSFLAHWRADEIGRFTVRAVVGGAEAHAAAQSATAQVTVYRPVRATWYGPGFYGRRAACGQRLSRSLLGVAHRTLACGTPVDVFYGGRSITLPVVDRGPFANGAHYDLTSAAAGQLGMTTTSLVGVLPRRGERYVPPSPAPPPYAVTGGTAPAP